MQISITARHMELTAALQDHAQSRMDKVSSEFPRLLSAHLILAVEKYRHIADLSIRSPGHVDVEAKEESSDMYASMDSAFDKALKQLRKLRDKMADHKSREGLGVLEVAIEERLQQSAEPA